MQHKQKNLSDVNRKLLETYEERERLWLESAQIIRTRFFFVLSFSFKSTENPFKSRFLKTGLRMFFKSLY